MTASTSTIERAYRVRLRLKPAQERQLLRLFGARRFVWNWAFRRKDEAWRADGTKLNAVALSREFTQLKTAPDTAWLAELPREPFNQTLRDFDKAWSNFFAGRAKRPRRKEFGTVMSARFTLDQRRAQVDREAGMVQLDGVGKVRFRVTEAMGHGSKGVPAQRGRRRPGRDPPAARMQSEVARARHRGGRPHLPEQQNVLDVRRNTRRPEAGRPALDLRRLRHRT